MHFTPVHAHLLEDLYPWADEPTARNLVIAPKRSCLHWAEAIRRQSAIPDYGCRIAVCTKASRGVPPNCAGINWLVISRDLVNVPPVRVALASEPKDLVLLDRPHSTFANPRYGLLVASCRGFLSIDADMRDAFLFAPARPIAPPIGKLLGSH
jgi:hypothetical protein